MLETNPATDSRKAALRDYFGPGGFERWQIIYGNGPVSFIRRTVREGHLAVVNQALEWLEEASRGKKLNILDAGCGPGVVSLSLARQGHAVSGCDLSPQMVEAARKQLESEPEDLRSRVSFVCSDLESLDEVVSLPPGGKFNAVICLDVLIYYPEDELARILSHLKRHAPDRIVFTYAPASAPLRLMHWLGKKFPRRHRATKLEIIGEKAVRRALAQNGWKLVRQRHFNKGFYHVVLAEAIA